MYLNAASQDEMANITLSFGNEENMKDTTESSPCYEWRDVPSFSRMRSFLVFASRILFQNHKVVLHDRVLTVETRI